MDTPADAFPLEVGRYVPVQHPGPVASFIYVGNLAPGIRQDTHQGGRVVSEAKVQAPHLPEPAGGWHFINQFKAVDYPLQGAELTQAVNLPPIRIPHIGFNLRHLLRRKVVIILVGRVDGDAVGPGFYYLIPPKGGGRVIVLEDKPTGTDE